MSRNPALSTSPQKGGAGGGTRTPTALRPTDFLTIYGFRRPALMMRGASGPVRGLDYPFALTSFEALGAARLVSTPSLTNVHSIKAWLGIGKADTSST